MGYALFVQIRYETRDTRHEIQDYYLIFFYSFLFKIINAPITPGIQPRQVRIKIIKKDPQPLSTTAKGGNIIANKTLIKDITKYYFF